MRPAPLAAVLAVHVALAACGAAAPACPVAPPSSGSGQPFLWRVQRASDDASGETGGAARAREAVVWLFGTIHDAGIDAVPRVALDALDGAPRVLTELGEEPLDPDVFRRHARIASGPGIDHQLSSDDWYDLRDALRGAIKEDDLRRAAPWYAMSLLTKQAGPKTPTMDTQLSQRATARDTAIDALETWEAQLAALSGVVTLADLVETIHARKMLHCSHDRMRATYVAGDADTMTALLVLPRTAEPLLYARNRAWLPRVERAFAEGGAFVAVGLGHLLGEQGLPTLLERAGYTVERVHAP